MVLFAYLGTALAAYLLGSIPTGYLLARARGIDIRTVGSGNIGATNAFRALGVPSGILVLVIDGLKGWVAAAPLPGLVMQVVMGAYSGVELDREYLMITAGIFVILGHNFTCWLRFRGGKGIATSAGALAALVPPSLVVIFAVWLVVFAASRYVSLASIAAAIALPLATWLLRYSHLLIFVTTLMAALALYKHRSNIRRLIAGTENRVGRPKAPTVSSL